MFDIRRGEDGHILISGRLDASQAERARNIFNEVSETTIIDFNDLEYISSAGLGVLLGTQKRLGEVGHTLKLINLNSHIREIFKVAGFDFIFDIE